MTINPADLGFYEARPGSGIWRHPAKRGHTYEPRTCENCDQEFMALRRKDAGRFCSRKCGASPNLVEAPGYAGNHSRVRRWRGLASDHPCTDCGVPANDWSQIHGTNGHDPQDYEPRCWKCHSEYDMATHPKGERVAGAVLTEEQVRRIRSSGLPVKDLSVMYGVSDARIRLILAGKAWRHVQ